MTNIQTKTECQKYENEIQKGKNRKSNRKTTITKDFNLYHSLKKEIKYTVKNLQNIQKIKVWCLLIPQSANLKPRKLSVNCKRKIIIHNA